MSRRGRPLTLALLACCLALALTTSVGLPGLLVAERVGATDTAPGPATAATGTAPEGFPGSGIAGLESSAGVADQPDPWNFQQGDQPAVDNTITRIKLAANGSATWTLRIRTRLETDARAEDYRTFQESFRENTSTSLGAFQRRMTGVVSNANDTFPREMRATEFDASTSIQEVPQRWGVVTYEFTWHGFAAVEGDRLVVGDVFAGGFFIDQGDVLEFLAPPGYTIEAADPEPAEIRDGAVEWRGREDFADGRPSLVAVPSGEASSTAGGLDPLSPAVLGGAVLVLVVVGVAATRLRDERRSPIAAIAGRLTSSGDTADARRDDTADGTVAGGAVPAGGTSETDPSAGSAGGSTDALLTDEDRVEALLAERDGRMKQADIVDELGWSKSKGSRVLSGMAEEGRIRKLRIGRENIIERQDDPVGDPPGDGGGERRDG